MKVYSWDLKSLPKVPDKPRIEDMDAGIGFMLRKIQWLTDEIVKVMASNKLLKAKDPRLVENNIDEWMVSCSGKSFYKLIESYVVDLKQLDKRSLERVSVKLDVIRTKRNYYVHQFYRDYASRQSEDAGSVESFLRKQMISLVELIGTINHAGNEANNIFRRVDSKVKAKKNEQRTADLNSLKSVISGIIRKRQTYTKYKEGFVLVSTVVNDLVRSESKNEWERMPGKPADKLESLGFEIGRDSENDLIMVVRIRK